jgi:hypothetical protein
LSYVSSFGFEFENWITLTNLFFFGLWSSFEPNTMGFDEATWGCILVYRRYAIYLKCTGLASTDIIALPSGKKNLELGFMGI